VANGATLTVSANGGTTTRLNLPAGTSPMTGKPFGGDATKGFKYKDAKGENGPVETALIKDASGVFQIKAVIDAKRGAYRSYRRTRARSAARSSRSAAAVTPITCASPAASSRTKATFKVKSRPPGHLHVRLPRHQQLFVPVPGRLLHGRGWEHRHRTPRPLHQRQHAPNNAGIVVESSDYN
jgi:hypothetical protein